MSKTVNTRIKLKYDTLANWTSNNPKLLAGEIALVSVPAEQTADNDTTPVMYKVGDGTNNFTDLQWGSAKAADVYSWAKQSQPKVSLSGSSGNVVTGISSNSDGITYSMSTIATTDTKYTAGATNDVTNKLFLIGAKTQDTSPQTYSDKLLYVQGEYLSAPSIVPSSSTAGYTLGTSTLKWAKAYVGTVGATSLESTYLQQGSSGQKLTIPAGTSGGTNTLALTSDIPTALPAQYSIKFKNTSASDVSYNGSSELDLTGGIYYASTAGSASSASTAGIAANLGTASGSYTYDTLKTALNNKADKSSIPTVNNGTLTMQVNGTNKATFTANQSGSSTFNVTAADLGLSAAMKFGGVSSQSLSEGGTQNAGATSGNYTTSTQPSNGTVYLDKAGHLEYVWVSGTSSALGHWELLGQDGSYALSSVKVIGEGALAGGGDLTTNRTITHNAGSVASKESGFYKFSTDAYSHVGSVTAVTKSDITALGIPSADTHYTSPFIVTVGSTTSSTSNTIAKFTQDSGERLTFLAGSNITLTPDTTNKTLTIANSYKYTLPTASSSALGGIKTGYTTSGKNYKVDVDTSGNAYVNVPWTDTDTNTWRTIRVDDQDVLSSETSSGALNFANGTYVQFSYDSGIKANLSNAVLTTDDQVIIDCGSSSVNVF